MKKLNTKWKRRPIRIKLLSDGKWLWYNWNTTEQLNEGLGVNHNNCIVDNHRYLRWKTNKKSCHRDFAFTNIYKKGVFNSKFSDYEVQHIDENKFNNQLNNLKIVFQEQYEFLLRRVI